MSKGMTTCKICERDFALIAEDHYIARGENKTGLAALAGNTESNLYDAINCPHCGCQMILQERKRPFVETVYKEEEKEGEDDE